MQYGIKVLNIYIFYVIFYMSVYREAGMKKTVFWRICFLMAVFSVNTVYGQGFTGAGSGTNTGQVQTVTVIQARNLSDNSLVILSLNKEPN
jgi:4-hydroxybenzoate polyprenyltransferase